MSEPLIILIVAAALLLATWYAGEWTCRRITARYASRRRHMWGGVGPDDGSDSEQA